MRQILRQHHISFRNAFAGLFWALRTQPNFRVHLVLATAAVWLGAYFNITRLEMVV
ncbi:MAG: diacylglycerol kinase family protein, partial [Patescibacteria group bacterium]